MSYIRLTDPRPCQSPLTRLMISSISSLLLIRTVVTYDQLLAWGWRIPFLMGSLNAVVALFLHYYGYEHHPNQGEYDTDDDGDDDGDNQSNCQKESEGRVRPRYPLREGKKSIIYYHSILDNSALR